MKTVAETAADALAIYAVLVSLSSVFFIVASLNVEAMRQKKGGRQ